MAFRVTWWNRKSLPDFHYAKTPAGENRFFSSKSRPCPNKVFSEG